MNATATTIRAILAKVNDPEVPVLSILDLGVVRNVETEGDRILITITPTYSGCPAMDVIAMDIRLKFIEHGYRNIIINQQLSPAWTTDWMSEEGKQKLKAYGIAPPQYNRKPSGMFEEAAVDCPLCHSAHTELLSEFSSTACKAMYRCLDCREAFDHFKCH